MGPFYFYLPYTGYTFLRINGLIFNNQTVLG